MTKEEQFLFNRLLDMAKRTYMSGKPEYSDFLNMNEQDIFLSNVSKLPPVNYELFGGHFYSERKVVSFTSKEFECNILPPVCAIRCIPVNKKYADSLSHRDYLGSLMNLGINRNKLGDFVFEDDICYIICSDSISNYITENLIKVKHTIMRTEKVSIEDVKNIEPQLIEVTGFISSNRLDSIIAMAYNTSRSIASEYISQGKVYINSKLIMSGSHSVSEKDIISVRGTGRFIFNNIITTTKKNRLMISISKY